MLILDLFLAPAGMQSRGTRSWLGCRSVVALCALYLMTVGSLSAQSVSINGGVVISYPLAGDVLENNSTIYFGPGEIDIYQWRITIGSSPAVSGLFDSGVKNFASSPWEQVVSGLPANGKPVTLRFWQRQRGGDWISSDTVYNTLVGGNSSTAVINPSANQSGDTGSKSPLLIVNNGPVVRELTAEHRSGQTFLTWIEVSSDAGYHVYRHSSPITEKNIRDAEKLTAKWGPLDNNTSVNKHAHGPVPATYVIRDSGQPLSESNGLFVHTNNRSGSAFYAVTTVVNGRESIAVAAGENSLNSAVSEVVAAPKPVLALTLNRGKGRVYTQFMDYANWNPTFNGYIYNYTVTLPSKYRKSKSYPLVVRLHAYGEDFPVMEQTEYDWQVVQIYPSDPGEARGAINSWWFGYAADHNYLSDGLIPTSGSVANFTEQRVMQAVEEVLNLPDVNVDRQKVHAFGHSMGASGSLSLGMRYGNIIAGIYGSEAMTNYATSPQFQEGFERLWGNQAANLPIKINGPYTDIISRYQGTGVWDWMNHHKQLVERRGERMAYLMLAQGKADDIIDWATQSAPMARVFGKASVGYSMRFVADAGHSWLGFSAIVHPLFGLGYDLNFPWRYPLNLSYPAITNASGSGSADPGLAGDDDYNMDIEWAVPHLKFDRQIVDEPRRYEISLRSSTEDQIADITPRNTQRFSVRPGERCRWTASRKRKQISSGVVSVDQDSLLTVPQVPIKYKGTRLSIDCR